MKIGGNVNVYMRRIYNNFCLANLNIFIFIEISINHWKTVENPYNIYVGPVIGSYVH